MHFRFLDSLKLCGSATCHGLVLALFSSFLLFGFFTILVLELLVEFLRLLISQFCCFDIERAKLEHLRSHVLQIDSILLTTPIGLKRPEDAATLTLTRELVLHKLVDGFILRSKRELIIHLVDLHTGLAGLEVDRDVHLLVNDFGAFLLNLEHLIRIVTLVLVQPGIVRLFEPVLLSVDDTQALRRVDIILDQLVAMLKRGLVL